MTPEEFHEIVGAPLESFACQCHAASIALVKAGVGSRVARGTAPGVAGQHSWVVEGMDCYDPNADVIDPTIWSYVGGPPRVVHAKAGKAGYAPHGAGSIWSWGRPDYPTGTIIDIGGAWSKEAEIFLDILGPLDMNGWRQLAHAPVEGWPAGEILARMQENPALAQWIPIDRIGMLTDLNPGGLYLPEEVKAEAFVSKAAELRT